VGNPAYISSEYQGPAGQGRGFTPGFDPANYPVTPGTADVVVPLANVFVDDDLTTPLTHELTASYAAGLPGGRGQAEAAYVFRRTTNMIEDSRSLADGTTHVTGYGLD